MGKNNTIEMTKKDSVLKMTGKLSAKHIKAGDGGIVIDLGTISEKAVTTAGCEYLVDSFQDSTTYPMDKFYWHGCGTSTGAEGVGETALGAEVETRTTGSQTETSSVIYKTVSTHTFTSTGTTAITEHGLFSSSGGATLWDRSLFAVINVGSGDGIEWTYELTCTAGG